MLAPFARRSSAVIAAILPRGSAAVFGGAAGAAFLTDEVGFDLGDVIDVLVFGFCAGVARASFLCGAVVVDGVDAVAVRGFGDRAITGATFFDCADLVILLSIQCDGISAVTSASPGRGFDAQDASERTKC